MSRVQSENDLFAELLLQTYPLDPGAIEYLIEEITKNGRDAPVELTCAILTRHAMSEVDRENLGHFVRRASGDPVIRVAFANSLKRKGRCPKRERKWLRSHLEPETSEPELRSPPHPRSTAEVAARLDLRDISVSLTQLPILFDRLGALHSESGALEIALGDFTYATALAVLADWILANDMVQRHRFVDCSTQMMSYLENIRFDAVLKNPEIVISPDPMDWAVGLTRINRDQPTEKVTDKIVDILDTFVTPAPDNREALVVLISEMIENVHRHANAPVDGIAVAQVYPSKLKMGITLVDAGMGVRRSFESGSPTVPIEHFRRDEDFLREAIRLHSTSKPDRHAGYGLFLLSELIARNRGTFLLTSGDATLVGYQRAGRLVVDPYHHEPWRGTIVSVIIDLKGTLPLLEIYGEMPVPKGYSEDDLFL